MTIAPGWRVRRVGRRTCVELYRPSPDRPGHGTSASAVVRTAWATSPRCSPGNRINAADSEDFFAWMRNNFDPTVTWRDLDCVRSEWNGPLIIKGILDRRGRACRPQRWAPTASSCRTTAAGSSMACLSTARALPAIVEKVGHRLTVLADGGVRSGLDVVRLLALGARGVLLGRAWVYALAGAGEQGVAHVLKLFEAEMRVAMALTGAAHAGCHHQRQHRR